MEARRLMARSDKAPARAGQDSAATLRAVSGMAQSEQDDPQGRLLHDRIRLAIVSALAVNESLAFTDLKALLETTDGNLSVHARKLEEAQYITCTKTFDGRTPKTVYRITTQGRCALENYLKHMEALIKAVRGK
jgi:DNA-binding transcriptional ArsR family regulator